MPQTFVPCFDHPRKTAFKKCNANEDVSSYVWTNKQQLGKNLVKHTGLSMGCFFFYPNPWDFYKTSITEYIISCASLMSSLYIAVTKIHSNVRLGHQ